MEVPFDNDFDNVVKEITTLKEVRSFINYNFITSFSYVSQNLVSHNLRNYNNKHKLVMYYA